jgi:predicted amidophosphoribosyltransferase
MKNIPVWNERKNVLAEAIQKGAGEVKNKCILLFDDLTESGSTLSRVAQVLSNEGGASAVYALVLTRTK